VVDGATLALLGSWSNGGTITAAAGSTLNLGGAFATGTLGTITTAGAVVNVTGTLTATNANPLTLDNTTGSWLLRAGTISGGTVTTTGSNVLASTNFGGTLAGGVTLNG